PIFGHADELVAQHSVESHVAADQLKIGLADASPEHADHRLAISGRWQCTLLLHRDSVARQYDRAHVPPTVRLKPDTTYSPTVRLKPDTTYSPTVRLKPDTTYSPTVRLKPDATCPSTVRL